MSNVKAQMTKPQPPFQFGIRTLAFDFPRRREGRPSARIWTEYLPKPPWKRKRLHTPQQHQHPDHDECARGDILDEMLRDDAHQSLADQHGEQRHHC